MNRALLGSLLALCVLASACTKTAPDDQPEGSESTVANREVTTALIIAEAVEKDPTSADSLLTALGMTRMGFDSLMFRIAGDSALSAEYLRRRP